MRQSYNEDLISPNIGDGRDDGVPNSSSFPCTDFLRGAGILEDFLLLVQRVSLTTYMDDESDQHVMLTKTFVESFSLRNSHFRPTVLFKIYDRPISMTLVDFCAAIGIAPSGTTRRIQGNPTELLELYRGVTNDDDRSTQRGKIRNIQLPAIRYFVYYLATSVLVGRTLVISLIIILLFLLLHLMVAILTTLVLSLHGV